MGGDEGRARRAAARALLQAHRAREGLGRSRGGLTTKIHAAADLCCRPLVRVASPGQRSDPRGLAPVMARLRIGRAGPGRPRTRPHRVLADKAYSCAGIRALLRDRGIKATIPVKDDKPATAPRGRAGGRPPVFDAGAYKARNSVERMINRLKRARAVALRTDKRLYVYTGTLNVASIDLWLRDHTRARRATGPRTSDPEH